jgi:hypothetical protein
MDLRAVLALNPALFEELSNLIPSSVIVEDGPRFFGTMKIACSLMMKSIWLLLLSTVVKFADLADGKIEGSRPDDKIQLSRSPRSAPIDEG